MYYLKTITKQSYNLFQNKYYCTYKQVLRNAQWKLLKKEMIEFFSQQENKRNSRVDINALEWNPYISKNDIWCDDCVPAIITGNGSDRRVRFSRRDIEKYAFDEPGAHLSYLFKGRLFNVTIGNLIEEVFVSYVQTDPVENHLLFIKMSRHTPGKTSVVDIPVTVVGMLACPAYLNGCQVELAMPTIKCEIIGKEFPPPFQVDVSNLKYTEPYSAIHLRDLKHLLPKDGTVRFERTYNFDSQEVIQAYKAGKIEELPLPSDYVDPNFLKKNKKRIQLTYKGYFPKQ